MTTDRIIIHCDRLTNRIVRISDYLHDITPIINLDETFWYITRSKLITNEIYKNHTNWLMISDRAFELATSNITLEQIARFALLKEKIDCIEKVHKEIIRRRRMLKMRIIPLDDLLIIEYLKEIDLFNSTKVAGELISSLNDDVVVGTKEFEMKYGTYLDFLRSSEVLINQWTRRILSSDDPYIILEQIKFESLGRGI